MIATITKLGIFYFASTFLIAKLFQINDYKRIFIPVSWLLTALSIFSFNISNPTEVILYSTVGNLIVFYIPTYIILIVFYLLAKDN
ncbi:hypothetical protein U472_01070 [Orenia metallireducens]|uniref:Spore germination protein n=1 Tax=Orenia metallireducens TaxID=1413210 RepID=A0A1C0ACZ8_9FIRM|nr:hypothetical protein U472_01070 [Orenia metallireducens]